MYTVCQVVIIFVSMGKPTTPNNTTTTSNKVTTRSTLSIPPSNSDIMVALDKLRGEVLSSNKIISSTQTLQFEELKKDLKQLSLQIIELKAENTTLRSELNILKGKITSLEDAGSPSQSSHVISQILQESFERQRCSLNTIIYGVPESSSASAAQRISDDCSSIRSLLEPHSLVIPDNSKVIRLVYKAIIRSKLDYGCFLFGSASFSNWNRLNKVQSSCLRSIMGYVRSSPLPAIEVESSCPPSNIRCRWLAGKFLLKSLSYSSSPIFDLFYSLFLTWRYVPKNLPVISLVANSVSPFHEYILTNIKLPIYEIEYQALLLPAQVLLFLIALVSMSCLQPLNSFSLNSHPSPLIIRIKSILFSLGQLDFNMQFLWVPSHVGFRGNEYSNSLAKSSSNFISPSFSPIPWSDFTPLLRHHIFNLWSAYWHQRLKIWCRRRGVKSDHGIGEKEGLIKLEEDFAKELAYSFPRNPT
ncbi:hypothetical protein QTP88_029647 [Uroleucon formosanum]